MRLSSSVNRDSGFRALAKGAWQKLTCLVYVLLQASFFDEILQMCATNLPVKLSFEKYPLSFEKKVFDFAKNLRNFVGRVVEFLGKDTIQCAKVFLGGNAMIP